MSFEVLGDVFHHEVTFDDQEGQVGISAQDRTTTMWGGGAVATFGFATGRHRPLARVELRAERARVEDRALELEDRGGGDRTLINLTAEDVVTLGRLTLAPSVRWETVDDQFEPGSAGTVPAPAESGRRSGWSGKFALSYALGPRTRLRGSVGHFYRNPSLTEFFGDRGAIVGNPRLLPEDGDALELGVSHQWARPSVSVELVGFARRTDNLIRLTPVGQGVAMPRNLGRVDTDGIESSIAWNGRRGFYAQASATAQRVTDVTTEPRPVPYQPELIGFVGAGWQNRRVRVRWDLTYTGSNSTDTLDTPELRMPERIVHDLASGYRFRSGVELGVDIRNVFDRQNRDLLRYPLPGRVVLVHLGWQSKAKAP